MTDAHREFFEHLDWFGREDCSRLPEELAWARRECPVVHSGYDGGQYVVTRYEVAVDRLLRRLTNSPSHPAPRSPRPSASWPWHPNGCS